MLPPRVLREARTAADTLYESMTWAWGHLLASVPDDGPFTSHNLAAGVRAANDDMSALEGHLRTFLTNIDRWNVRRNYNVQFVVNVTYWSDNLASQAHAAADQSLRQGVPAAEVLEAMRNTFNYLRDPYNFGTFAELLPHGK